MSELWFYAYSEDSESWVGPWESQEAAALAAFTDDDSESEVVYVNTGVWLDPATLIDSGQIFERLDDSGENSPIEDDWQNYWGLKSSDMSDLDVRLAAAFREWAEERKLPKYYQVGHDLAKSVMIKRKSFILQPPPHSQEAR